MLLSRDAVLQRAWSLRNTSGPGQTGVAAAARLGDDGSPPSSIHHRLEHLFTLFLPGVVEGLGNSWNAPGAKHSLMHGAGQCNRRVAGRQGPQHGAEGPGRLGQVFPGATKLHRHPHQGYAQFAQLFVIGRVGISARLPILPFGGPLPGQFGGVFQNGCYAHGANLVRVNSVRAVCWSGLDCIQKGHVVTYDYTEVLPQVPQPRTPEIIALIRFSPAALGVGEHEGYHPLVGHIISHAHNQSSSGIPEIALEGQSAGKCGAAEDAHAVLGYSNPGFRAGHLGL